MPWWTPILKPALGVVAKTIDRIVPDKNAAARAKELLKQTEADFESDFGMAMTDIIRGQVEINAVEAKHPSIFVAGWRPSLGWVCSIAFLWHFIIQPILSWILLLIKPDILLPPILDVGTLMPLVLGMLGLGGMRSYEKLKGVARQNMT